MKRFFVAAVVLAVAGCSGAQGLANRSAAPAAETVNQDIACTRACNRDFRVCEDQLAVRRGGTPEFGAGAACQRELGQCLRQCQPPTPRLPGASRNDGQSPNPQP